MLWDNPANIKKGGNVALRNEYEPSRAAVKAAKRYAAKQERRKARKARKRAKKAKKK